MLARSDQVAAGGQAADPRAGALPDGFKAITEGDCGYIDYFM